MTAFVPVKETWRDLDEVKIGERRSWFTGTEERQQRPWYERWCGSILKAGLWTLCFSHSLRLSYDYYDAGIPSLN